jgi:hypothetical protein
MTSMPSPPLVSWAAELRRLNEVQAAARMVRRSGSRRCDLANLRNQELGEPFFCAFSPGAGAV